MLSSRIRSLEDRKRENGGEEKGKRRREREAGHGISFSLKIAFRIMHKSPFPPTILCVTFVNHGIYVSKERRDLRSTLTNDYAIMPDNSTAVNRMKNIVSYAGVY